MRKLQIEYIDLEAAFESSSDFSSEYRYILDAETGKVHLVGDEERQTVEALVEEAAEDTPFEEILENAEIPEAEREVLRIAYQSGYELRDHLIEVPSLEPRVAFEDMEDFVDTVEDKRLRSQLTEALRGRKPFARFKDVLYASFHDRERWYAFREERLREHIVEWLSEHDIEPEFVTPAALSLPQPPVRLLLLEAVQEFLLSAAKMPGVKRIALIGSLTTAEPSPKDADLLVTITDEMELTALAKAGRRLLGKCQQAGRSGEVFLADTRNKYLGRTCPWKQCEPGIRLACDALHCGRRHYLHDDLRATNLEAALIQAPPIELWPYIVTRVPVPEDVEQYILAPLRGDSRPL